MGEGFTGRKNQGRGHSYWIDGVKVKGVTTILSDGLPKPALVKWAANSAADLACDRWDELTELPLSERRKLIAGAPDAARSSAAVRGTRVHALADKLASGEEVAVPDELAGHVDSCVRFLDEWDPEVIATEMPVLSRQWKYGGTLDAIMEIDGRHLLVDWKTNKSGPFGDTAFQLAAYRYAEFTMGKDGSEQRIPHIDDCAVIWVRADGYDIYPYEAGRDVWREFLYIAQTARAAENCRDYKGDAMLPPVRSAS